jgi:hypothetical protein
MRQYLLGLSVLWVLVGCGDRSEKLEQWPDIAGRARLGQELLFVDRTDSVVHALDVMTKKPSASVDRIDVPAGPSVVAERPGADEVLVLCQGERDEDSEWVQSPQLAVIDAKHKVRNYDLSVAFSQIELSRDGRYALLHNPSNEAGETELLSNPNRVALVDLASAPSESNPVERTLKAMGGQLSKSYLIEPLEINGNSRPIALFTFANGLSVWDLSHPERPEIASEGLAANGSVTLDRIVADPDEGKLYLLQSGLSDLRVLDLNNVATSKDNDFWPSWNQLPLGSTGASDLVLYGDSDEPRVIAALGGQVRVIDSDDSRVVGVAVPGSVTQFYSFVGKSPNDSDEVQRLVGWDVGESSVVFIELAQLESRGTRNMEALELGQPLKGLVKLNDTQVLTVFDYDGIGVLNLETRRFTPLSSSLALSDPLIQSDAERVWVGATDDNQVAFFSPNSLETWSMGLDDPIEDMFLFEKNGERKIVVTHSMNWGHVTVIDGEKPSRATSTVVEGFLLDGLVK